MTGFAGEIVRGTEDVKMLASEVSFLTELKEKFKSMKWKIKIYYIYL